MRSDTKALEWGRLNPLILVVALALAYGATVSAQTLHAKVGDDVFDLVRLAGRAQVVIALLPTPSLRETQGSLPGLRREVRLMQQDVLDSLALGDFQLKDRYLAVPALSGTILSEDALMMLAGHPLVARIDVDAGGTGGLANSVPFIGATQWHASGFTGTGVVVAVLDSGLDTDHADFAGALIHEECFLDNDGFINGSGRCPNGSDRQSGTGAAEDDAGHGSHVTGIVASRGVVSSVGVAPGAQIVSVKVTAGPSFSGVFWFFSEITAALDYIINNRPDVTIINMSLVTNALFAGNCDNATSWTMAGAAAINTLYANGVTAFASSGNNGSGTQMAAPACLSNVVSVGAVNNSDVVAAFSNSNSTTDVFAPGVNVVSDVTGGGLGVASGTSMASPHAAGCAALLRHSGVATTPSQIVARLKSSPFSVTDSTNGLSFPRIDCRMKYWTFLPLVRRP